MADFVYPLIAIGVVISVIAQMFLGQFPTTSVGYVVILGAILGVLSLLSVAKTLATKSWKLNADHNGNTKTKTPDKNRYLFVFVLFLLTFVAILSIDKFGYVFVIFSYLIILGRLFYKGPWWITFGVSTGMILFVHFLFVEELQLGFPPGSVWHDLYRYWVS